MKEIMLNIIEKYLDIYPYEKNRLSILKEYIDKYNDKKIIDWNNFDGHIVASGFIYDKKTNKFLVLYHNDMKIYLYPGGHINNEDHNPLEAAIREVEEETGLNNLKIIRICDDELIPFDIDTHIIEYNERLDLPSHYHFDIRYLFEVDSINDIKIDEEELRDYKWIDYNELKNDLNFGKVIEKIENILYKD